MKLSKTAILESLQKFIAQRSGIDFQNYQSGDPKGGRDAFMGDYRPILKHGRQARQMLRAIELRDSITAENIMEATRAFSGRLQIEERDGKARIDYTTGQYFPTEYRRAACAVLARCLWDYWRNCASAETDGEKTSQAGIVNVSGYIRKQAKRELGRGIAADWFA